MVYFAVFSHKLDYHPFCLSIGCFLVFSSIFLAHRRDGRAVEGARLESVYTETYRGFESLSLRQL
ncbi:hypothetical protein Lade_0297 [Legionella adelaidensis]|uniref:Uncharacterized protein n=1 Tax=Legionella adelaidensis TaxID=45056 RepID=A0A0W0R3L9_9GAMM|nr:hypothetical protein Lade_0297 [Legionella adelaidensis]